MYSFFIIALKMDMTMLFRVSKSAWTIGLAGTILPWVTVFSLFYTQLNYLPTGLHPKVITFFVSANVSLTFFPMVGYALDELNLITSELGHLAMSSALVSVDAQISLSAMCRLTIGRGWVELVLMGCWAQNSKPGPWACLMADGALLPDLLLYWAFWGKIRIRYESPFLSTQDLLQTASVVSFFFC